MESEDFKPAPAIYHRLNQILDGAIWESIVPILAVKAPELRQHGTGTLFRIGEESFLVTAAHVIRAAQEAGYFLCTANAHSGDYVGIKGQVVLTGEVFDLAILSLDSTAVEGLKEHTFLGLHDVHLGQTAEDIYCICGFPSMWSKEMGTITSVKPLQFTTHIFDGHSENLGNYDAQHHILLNADKDWVRDVDGNEVEFPSTFGGISGGAVWRTFALNSKPDEWKPSQCKLVGLETSIYKGKVIKATRWPWVFSVLVDKFPHLRPALSIWLPSSVSSFQ